MEDQGLNRRRLLGAGVLAAGGAALLPGAAARAQLADDLPDLGPAQAPTITDPRDKVAYITGASSGIGLGIAKVFHEAGMKVVIGYRSAERIPEVLAEFPENDPRIALVQHDVIERDSWEAKADEIESHFGPVHILVNNAGVGLQGRASTGTLNDWEWGMAVNFFGPVYGVHTFVPRMLAHGEGSQIVTTTSTSGILPGSGAGIYTVAKMAAVSLMEELRHELRDTNIGTTAFIPGLTVTNIGDSERGRPEDLRNEGQAAPAGGGGGGMSAAMTAVAMTPVESAQHVLEGILHNDLFISTHKEYRVGVEARCNALLESMVPAHPLPEARMGANLYRTPIYVQEIQHRRATRARTMP